MADIAGPEPVSCGFESRPPHHLRGRSCKVACEAWLLAAGVRIPEGLQAEVMQRQTSRA